MKNEDDSCSHQEHTLLNTATKLKVSMGTCCHCRENKSADPMESLSFNLRHEKQTNFPFPLPRTWPKFSIPRFHNSLPLLAVCLIRIFCVSHQWSSAFLPVSTLFYKYSTFPWGTSSPYMLWWQGEQAFGSVRNSKSRELDLAAKPNLNRLQLFIVFIYPMCEDSHVLLQNHECI